MNDSLHATDSVVAELRWLKGLASALTSADADDLVQDTWISASRAQPDPDRPLRPWLGRVLRNHARMRWRAHTRRESRERTAGGVPAMAAGDPERVIARAETFAEVADLVAKLDPGDRTMLIARYCDDLSPTEIAKRLGLPAPTVRSRLHRTLKRLRAELDDRHGGRAWALALAPQWSSLTTLLTVTKGASMGMALKLGLGAAAAVSLALWILTEPSPKVSTVVAVGAARDRTSAVADATSKRGVWERRVRALRSARKRLHAAPEPDSAASPLTDSQANTHSDPLWDELHEVLSDAVRGCQEANPSAQGFVELRAAVLGEPELGAVVEHVEITDTDIDSAALQECLQESIYTMELSSPADGVEELRTVSLHVGRGVIAINPGEALEELAVEGATGGFSLRQRVLETSGGIDTPDAEAVVRSHSMVIIHCFLSIAEDREVADFPYETDVRVEVDVGSDGAATPTTLTISSPESEGDIEALRACVAGAIARWSFPAKSEGGAVSYSFGLVADAASAQDSSNPQ